MGLKAQEICDLALEAKIAGQMPRIVPSTTAGQWYGGGQVQSYGQMRGLKKASVVLSAQKSRACDRIPEGANANAAQIWADKIANKWVVEQRSSNGTPASGVERH
jgi:hypothetical protein